MNEPKTSWLQRLVGSDGSASLASLEEQLARATEEGRTLREALEQERERVSARDEQLEQARTQARESEQDFATRLAEVRLSVEEKLESCKAIEQEHQKAVGELEAARAMVRKITDEKNKQVASLTRLRDESVKLTKGVAAANNQAQEAQGRAEELERASAALAKELAEAKRRHEALETRASTLEHELAQTKQAQLSSEGTARELQELTQRNAEQQKKLTRVEAELRDTGVHLSGARAQRDLALTMANDLWAALERTVGDAASLALVMGVDLGKVERSANLADAASALKRSFEERALCQGIQVEPFEDGMAVELRALQVPRTGAAPRWLVASATRFLERAAGLDLAIESSDVDRDTLRFRLRTSAGARAV